MECSTKRGSFESRKKIGPSIPGNLASIYKKEFINFYGGIKEWNEAPKEYSSKLKDIEYPPFICLPTEIHGIIIGYLNVFDVDKLMSLSKVVSKSFSFPEVWIEWNKFMEVERRWLQDYDEEFTKQELIDYSLPGWRKDGMMR